MSVKRQLNQWPSDLAPFQSPKPLCLHTHTHFAHSNVDQGFLDALQFIGYLNVRSPQFSSRQLTRINSGEHTQAHPFELVT